MTDTGEPLILTPEAAKVLSESDVNGVQEADLSEVNPGAGIVIRSHFFGGKIDEQPQNLGLLQQYQLAYDNFPLVKGAVEKAVQYTVQDFYFRGPDEKLLNELKQTANLVDFVQRLARLRFAVGSVWVEPLLENPEDPKSVVGFKFLPTETMSIIRDLKGRPLAHVQEIGKNKQLVWGTVDNRRKAFKSNARKVGEFKDLIYNMRSPLGSEKYGKPLIHSSLEMLHIKGRLEDDLKVTAQRYIAPIIHARVGTPEEPASSGVVTAVGSKLKDIYADTEYATGSDVELKVLKFNEGGFDIQWLLNHVDNQILIGMSTPPIMVGKSMGTDRAVAEVNLRDYGRFIKSEQRSIKTDIEDQFIQNFLGLSQENELVWADVEERERMENIQALQSLFQGGLISLERANSLLPKAYQDPQWAAEQQAQREQMMQQSMQMNQQAMQQGGKAPLQKPTKDPTTKSVGGINKNKTDVKNPLDSKGRNPSAGDK